ncbi:hypothetical protein D3C73_1210690 [compost metagenome]
MRLRVFARAGFRHADAGHLRVRIGAGGNAQGVDGVYGFAGDGFHAQYAFVAGLVGKPGRAGHVADGVNAGLGGTAKTIGDDVGFLDLYAGLLQPQVLDIADDAGGDDDAVYLQVCLLALLFQRHLDARVGQRGRRDGALRHDADALLFKRLACHLRDLRVFLRQDFGRHVDQRHVGSDGAVEAGELRADRACAHHQQSLWDRVRHQGLAIGPDAFAHR